METEDLPVWRRIVNFLCGIESNSSKLDVTKQESADPNEGKSKIQLAKEAAEFLYEAPNWKRY